MAYVLRHSRMLRDKSEKRMLGKKGNEKKTVRDGKRLDRKYKLRLI